MAPRRLFLPSGTIAFNLLSEPMQGDESWRALRKYRSSGQSADRSCARWCLWQTAPFMRWNGVENFLVASPFRRGVLSGICAKSRPGWPLAERHLYVARNILTSASAAHIPSKSGIECQKRHRRRDKDWDVLLARNPGVDDVRPLLHHMATLHFVFGFVVDAARRAAVLVR